MCHGQKAEKSFDSSKAIDALTNTILKGNSSSKPPMPAFETKGLKPEDAKAFAEYMISLKNPSATNTANTNTSPSSGTTSTTLPKIDDQTIAFYKTNCAMCHGAKAEKAFDPTKADNDYIQVIVNGKKTDKPPVMPAFQAKLANPDQAKALALYMRKLRICDSDSATNTTAAKPQIDEKAVATYKAKCAMCHGQKAEKLFDTTKADDVLVNTVLKGNKTSKPPMPAYEETATMKADEAKSLVTYMRSLKTN
jgi:mono/diheme cytochrome c family protein